MSLKNSNGTVGNRTRDLRTCSAVPQPTALPRAPEKLLHQVGDLFELYDDAQTYKP